MGNPSSSELRPEKLGDTPPNESHIEDSTLDAERESGINEKALIRKIDWRLLPILGALYAIALIDRVNISNARVAGMDKELGLSIGSRYTIALVVFFIPYFIFELPSNIVLRKVGSANWLAFVAFGWGSFMLGQIIEGLLTQVVGILSWFLIIDFPDKAQKKGFLTEEEAEFIKHRIEKDRADAVHDPLTWAVCIKHLQDLKLWAFAFMFMSTTMPAYAFAYFSPSIIAGMGYSGGIANLLSAPPVIFAVIVAFTFAWLGDRYRVRAPIIAAQCIIGIIGLMITAYHKKAGVRYFGIFLGTAGCQGNVPAILAYQSNNIRLQSKRSVGSALQIGFGAIGGIIASTTFREEDAPRYVPGLWTTAGLQFFILALVGCTTFQFMRRNKQVDAGTATKPIEGLEGFKYTL
ncbi:hypothetical protein FQN53_005613 [Emmonsiellopsis sp. PD_33]|nr:hypothetical protein FQN53_005613 [Emmonsiellopsis sp. PD_33]